MSVNDTVYLLMIFLGVFSFSVVAYSLPLAQGRRSKRRAFVVRQLPFVTLICTMATLLALGYSFVIATAEASSISYNEFRIRSGAIFSPKSSVDYSVLGAVWSALAAREDASGIDCRQFTLLPNGNWNLNGSMTIGGATFSHISNIGNNFAQINGVNVKSIIDNKCRSSIAANTPSTPSTPAP